MPSLILGISSSIAAIKVPEIIRGLQGWDIQCIQTAGSKKFVTPEVLAALTGRKSLSSFEDDSGTVHITTARFSPVALIAPASANCLAKLALGIADSLFYTEMLAFQGRLIVAPAMNPSMWNHPAIQAHVETLKRRGVEIISPVSGEMICREIGVGKMATVQTILNSLLNRGSDKNTHPQPKILLNYGATRSYLDPVRFLTNGSTGQMGRALIQAFQENGSQVTSICAGLNDKEASHHVVTNPQMEEVLRKNFPSHDWFIGAAAICDYEVENYSKEKDPKKDHTHFELKRSRDLIAGLPRHSGSKIIGFCLDSLHGQALLERGKEKLLRKNLDAIVANPLETMGSTEHQGFVIFKDGSHIVLNTRSKEESARSIVKALLEKWKS